MQTLAYTDAGEGDAVVFIHGSLIADAFRPLTFQRVLADRYRLITYRRRGYAGSVGPAATTLAEQAEDCCTLLQDLGVERAHVVGHSFGGTVALRLALDEPELVRTLALIEPGLAVGESASSYRLALRRGMERYRDVGARAAVDEFLELRWPGYRRPLERVLPGAFEQAVADAPACYESELPAVVGFRLTELTARTITQPVLVVLGGDSVALDPRFAETQRMLLEWFPNAKGLVVSSTTHMLHVEAPRVLADGLADFYALNPAT